MSDIGLEQMSSTPMMCDNQGTIALVKNPTLHSHMKHIDIQHHFIHEKIERGVIQMKYIPMQQMIVDVFTKALTLQSHDMNSFEKIWV